MLEYKMKFLQKTILSQLSKLRAENRQTRGNNFISVKQYFINWLTLFESRLNQKLKNDAFLTEMSTEFY